VSVSLITGDDPSLVLAAVGDVVHRLVGEGDRTLMVDDFDGEEFELGAAVDAAQTPPFLTETRVVIIRGLGRFNAEQASPLVAYLSNQMDTTDLVLVAGGGRIAKSLTDALKAAKVTKIETAPPTRAGDRRAWFSEHIEGAGLRLDGAATALITSWLGEDAGRLQGILDTLIATYGTDKRLGVEHVEPFLGDAGGVPPWDLTDAIDQGQTTKALGVLQRMLNAGDRHPLQVMTILHQHFSRLLALDGSGARDEAAAAAAMGIKPGFPARKALEQYQRLGGTATARAIGMLATADQDLRGARELPEELVMEVLVARLSRLVPARR